MPTLKLKSTHKPFKAYYATPERFARLGVTHETAARLVRKARSDRAELAGLIALM